MKSQDDADRSTMRDHLRLGVLESLGGLLLGLPLGFLGAQLGRWLGNQSGPANSWRDLVGAIAGGAGGYLLGVAAGMSFVRRRRTGSGSFWIALAGGFAGGLLAILAVRFLGLDRYGVGLPYMFAVLAPVGAVIALHSWQPWRGAAATTPQ
jgi:hypothetical protein